MRGVSHYPDIPVPLTRWTLEEGRRFISRGMSPLGIKGTTLQTWTKVPNELEDGKRTEKSPPNMTGFTPVPRRHIPQTSTPISNLYTPSQTRECSETLQSYLSSHPQGNLVPLFIGNRVRVIRVFTTLTRMNTLCVKTFLSISRQFFSPRSFQDTQWTPVYPPGETDFAHASFFSY